MSGRNTSLFRIVFVVTLLCQCLLSVETQFEVSVLSLIDTKQITNCKISIFSESLNSFIRVPKFFSILQTQIVLFYQARKYIFDLIIQYLFSLLCTPNNKIRQSQILYQDLSCRNLLFYRVLNSQDASTNASQFPNLIQ